MSRTRPQAQPRPSDEPALVAQAARMAVDGDVDGALRRIAALPRLAAAPRRERDRMAGRVLGDALLQGGAFPAAEALARHWTARSPGTAEPALLLARALFGTDRLDEALEAARRASALAPGDIECRLQEVVTLFDLGRGDEALAVTQALVANAPGVAEAAALHGLVLRRAGMLDAAIRQLEQAVAAHPGHPQPLLWLAHALHDAGRNELAAARYQAVIRLAPGSDEAHFGLSNTLADAGRLAEAAQVYGTAARTLPGFTQGWPDLLLPLDLLAAPLPSGTPTGPEGLRAVVAFVPFERPVVPLSPAAIKAYVEAHSPHRVTAIDLNARFFAATREALAHRLTPFELPDTKGFLAAAELLSADSPAFFDPDSFGPAAAAFFQQATALKTIFTRQCHRIRQFDGPIPWHARAMARAMVAAAPAVIGLSAMFDSQLPMTHALARAIKSLAPTIKVILGGSAFNRNGLEAVLGAPYIDFVGLKDGEELLIGLMDALARGETEPDLPGLNFRRADGGFTIRDDTKPLRQDQVPPADFDDYDLGAYFTPRLVLPVLTSRGCYWARCTFCNAFDVYAGRYTAKTPVHAVDEMEAHQRRYGVRHFYMVDKMISPARFRKMGEEILARGLDLTYYGLSKPTADFTPDILDVMFRSGCRYVHWGQESGSDRILDRMDKGNTAAESGATLRAAAAAGIRNHLFMIVGFPGEGIDELAETVRFLVDNAAAVDQVQCGPFVLEKGTPLERRPQDFGIARIFDRRSEGALQLLRFESAIGFQPAQAQAAEKALRRELLGEIAGFSSHLGALWDHALIVYSELPRGDGRAVTRPAEAVIAAIRAAVSEN